MDEDIAQFVAITGASETVARQILDITDGDLSQAATLYFDNPGAFAQESVPGPAAAGAAPATSASGGLQHTQGAPASRPPARGRPIAVDSDDDEDGGDNPMAEYYEGANAHARTAQEEADAAIAKRLQEELYAENTGAADDDVRAPIARTTETLVGPVPGYGMGGGGDMDEAILEHIRRRRRVEREHMSRRAGLCLEAC